MNDESVVCKECGCVLEGLVPVELLRAAERIASSKQAQLTRLQNEDKHRLEEAARMPDAKRVWDHWLSTFHANAKARYKFGDKRKEVILKALGDYTVEELCEAVTGAQFSQWHVENGYTDVATLLANDKAIDAHRGRYAKAKEAGVV